MTHRNGITPVSKQAWLVVAKSIVDGSIVRANQVPIVDSLTRLVSDNPSKFSDVGCDSCDLQRVTPDSVHRIPKHTKDQDQITDCSFDERIGSMANGKESKASMEPRLDNEYSL